MKNTLKNISIFVVGAGLGVAGSYKFFETKFGNIADEEIESMKMAIKNNRMKAEVGVGECSDGKLGAGPGMKCPEKVEDGSIAEELANMTEEELAEYKAEFDKTMTAGNSKTYENITRNYKEGKRVVPNINVPRQKTNYAGMSNPEPVYNEIDENDITDNTKLEPHQIPDEPTVISVDEFVTNVEEYDQITLTYYAKDHVVVDENFEPMNEYVDAIGPDALNHFGESGCEDNLLYVRNDKLEICYEVIKLEESYV